MDESSSNGKNLARSSSEDDRHQKGCGCSIEDTSCDCTTSSQLSSAAAEDRDNDDDDDKGGWECDGATVTVAAEAEFDVSSDEDDRSVNTDKTSSAKRPTESNDGEQDEQASRRPLKKRAKLDGGNAKTADVLTTDPPTAFDVIFGRGRTATGHPGNARFLRCMVDQVELYDAASKSGEASAATAVAMRVVDAIRNHGIPDFPRGRFLEECADGGAWREVDFMNAVEKAEKGMKDMLDMRKEAKDAEIVPNRSASNDHKADPSSRSAEPSPNHSVAGSDVLVAPKLAVASTNATASYAGFSLRPPVVEAGNAHTDIRMELEATRLRLRLIEAERDQLRATVMELEKRITTKDRPEQQTQSDDSSSADLREISASDAGCSCDSSCKRTAKLCRRAIDTVVKKQNNINQVVFGTVKSHKKISDERFERLENELKVIRQALLLATTSQLSAQHQEHHG